MHFYPFFHAPVTEKTSKVIYLKAQYKGGTYVNKNQPETPTETPEDPALLDVVVWDPLLVKARGFEVISSYREENIHLPSRKTRHSAGYDLEAAEDATIEPRATGVVKTGLKAYMQPDEVLEIHIRSGVSFKGKASLLNDVGVIDSDYYNNPSNEGHILIGIVNHSDALLYIGKGERIAQGIFKKYLTVDGDQTEQERKGGIGSTGT